MPVLQLSKHLPELVSDLAGGPAEWLGPAFGKQQAINPVCYLGAGIYT